ncbi:MAG: hypothetical protein C0485_15660 [Pirellula sp.]|nr:hypothetical protein [Pirellula sp.]
MPGLLEALFGNDTETVEKVRTHTGNDPQRAEQAYGAAVGTILRGLENKSKTKEGAESIWEMLRKQVEQGNLPADAPASGKHVQVRDMDPKAANEMLKTIFGKDAPDVEGAYGKVITLDPEASRKVFAKVLPAVLGGIFGAAERAPEASAQALPKIVGKARTEIEDQQPKAKGIFDAILDRDHDGDVDMDDLNQLASMFMKKPR